MKLCILGNSHIVSIREGWPLAQDVTAGFAPTFVSAPGDQLGGLSLENGRLIPSTLKLSVLIEATSDAIPYIDLQLFDAFLLVGLMVRLRTVLEVYATHRLSEHAGPSHDLISRPALRAAILENLRATSMFSLLSDIRRSTAAPIIVMPEPFAHPEIVNQPQGEFYRGTPLEMLVSQFREAVETVVAPYQATVHFQPNSTFSPPAFTLPAYCEGAGHMWKGKVKREGSFWKGRRRAQGIDFTHTNDKFGALMLRQALPLLEAAINRQAGLAHPKELFANFA